MWSSCPSFMSTTSPRLLTGNTNTFPLNKGLLENNPRENSSLHTLALPSLYSVHCKESLSEERCLAMAYSTHCKESLSLTAHTARTAKTV